MQRQIYFTLVVVLVVLTGLNSFVTITAQAETDFTPITVDNVSKLELGYVLPAVCGAISPDSRYIVTGMDRGGGVYEIATGKFHLDMAGGGFTTFPHSFSGDGRLIVFAGDGVYDVATGQKRFSVGAAASFSPDGQWLSVDQEGVYEVATGEFKFPISSAGVFSPDSRLVAVPFDGVYEIATGKLLLPISNWGHFSPDNQMVAVSEDGVYDLTSGRKVFKFAVPQSAYFSADGTLLVVEGDGVYDTTTWENRFKLLDNDRFVYFFSDHNLLAARNGIYNAETGQLQFISPGESFFPNLDGTLVSVIQASEKAGIYSTVTGEKVSEISGLFEADDSLVVHGFTEQWGFGSACLIYGLADNPWPYRSGLIRVGDTPVSLFDVPNGIQGNVKLEKENHPNPIPVFARTADNRWLKVGGSDQAWVKAADVEIVFMPDGIPVEEQ